MNLRPDAVARAFSIVAVWLVLFVPRPFQLGFYSDDWVCAAEATRHGGAFSCQRFAWHLRVDSSRPVAASVRFLLSSVCGDSPFWWQAAAAAVALAVAFSIYGFAQALLKLWGVGGEWSALLAPIAWLSFPWTMGGTVFLTLVPMLASSICFAWCGKILLEGWRGGKANWKTAALLYLVGLLAYENYYGQFLIFLGIAFVLKLPGTRGWELVARPIFWLGLAQAIAFLFNRIHNATVHPTLSVVSDWPRQFLRSIIRLPWAMSLGAQGVCLAITAVGTLCVALLVVAAIRQWRAAGGRERVAQALGLAAVVGVGALISLLVYSLVGYSVTGIGIFSRTTLALSFLLAIVFSIASALAINEEPPLRNAIYFLLATIIGVLAVAGVRRLSEWSEVWNIEQRILASAPAQRMAQTGPDSVILYAGPLEHKGIKVFEGWWDLTAAMNHQYPSLRTRHSDGSEKLRQFAPLDFKWLTTWDGDKFEQEFLTARKREIDTTELWLWRADTASLTRIRPPFRYGRPIWIKPPLVPLGSKQN